MKKLMTAALAAVLALAMTAVAISQTTTRTHTMDGKVTPTDSGTKKKPKSAKASVSLTTPEGEDSNVDKFTFLFPETLKVSTKGFKRCTSSDIEEEGGLVPKKCNKARVGTGEALGHSGRRTGAAVPLDVQIFTLDSNELLVYVAAKQGSGLESIRRWFPAQIQNSSDPDFGQQIVGDVPADLENIGAPVILESLSLNIGKQVKKKTKRGTKRYRLISSRGCPANKQWLLGSKVEYHLPSGAPDTFARATTPCKK